jgi:hypothetical protein
MEQLLSDGNKVIQKVRKCHGFRKVGEKHDKIIKYYFKIVFQASLKLNDALKHPGKKLSTKSMCHPRSCDVPGKGSVDPGYPQIYLENS